MALDGFGIGVRSELLSQLFETRREIDWLEITPENWIHVGGPPKRQIDQCRERWPITPHGVSMSIGGPSPLDADLFRAVTALCHELDAPFWSDHISYATLRGVHFNDLLPLPFSDEAIAHVLQRIGIARTMTDVPLVFENPTFYARMPGSTLPEAVFLRTIIEESGAGFLLDVNNVYVNSQNHGFDPEAFIRELPLHAVRQIHVAGHTRHPNVIVDTHDGPIPDPVWSLYRYTLRAAGRQIPTLVEWDMNVPSLDVVCDELDRARAEAEAALPALPALAALAEAS